MTSPVNDRLYLSPPHLSGREAAFVNEAFASNWIAPLGPQVDAFEQEFSALHDGRPALGLCSGTAALHLALIAIGVQPGDDVFVSTLTFAGSVFPISYVGARPVFIDSERTSWNMDAGLLTEALEQRARRGVLPKAVIVVHLYGQSADMGPIEAACDRFGVPLIEDAAEALGGRYHGRPLGTFGRAAIFSFNGNKIVTTSGGGMLISADRELLAHARKLATQARDPFVHYEHSEIGYNYRMSNLLAGVGRGQLATLADRVLARRRIFDRYVADLGDVPGCAFMPEAPWAFHTRWLTCLTVDEEAFGATRDEIITALEATNIESRPLWKPMHLQPVFAGSEHIGGRVAESLFRQGLCLPSGGQMTDADVDRVATVLAETGSGVRTVGRS
jgi:dTDP-4-amino-4,6-dideoxygalactose transaminase